VLGAECWVLYWLALENGCSQISQMTQIAVPGAQCSVLGWLTQEK
jgi:hypothetical protein